MPGHDRAAGAEAGHHHDFPAVRNPCFVKADRTRLKQVLINLLSNAIKYNKTGGTVVVDCSAGTSGHIRISVTDTGAGLSAEKLSQLFQSFNRLGQEASGEEGTGIGLVVSKRLVNLMRGLIGVESTVGTGSVFWIELIAAGDPHLESGKAESTTVARITRVLTGPRPRLLLYVEDNPANLKLVEQLIARRPDLRLLTCGQWQGRHRSRPRLSAGCHLDGHQSARHERHRGHENPPP